MPTRFRPICTWVTLMALLLTPLIGSGAVVYCVAPGDHAAIEFAHAEQRCDHPADGEENRPGVAGTNLVSASPCVDQPLVEEATSSSISTSRELVIVSPVSLRYELPDLETLHTSHTFARWQDHLMHPELSVVQSVVLLI
ncbi:MAG: hypothetical protein WDZ31_02035 [Phycisphaeraceae bacterium]